LTGTAFSNKAGQVVVKGIGVEKGWPRAFFNVAFSIAKRAKE
jgi:hypothetical protein